MKQIRLILTLALVALLLTACGSPVQPAWTLEGASPSPISEWPQNRFTAAIARPDGGIPDYVFDLSAQGRYGLFIRDISAAESSAYMQALAAQGYREISSDGNSVSVGTLLQRENVRLSISRADGVMGILISID